MKKILVLSILLWAGLANAADNAVTLTTGSGVTMRTTDVGAGVQSSNVILSSTAGAAIYGTAGTANANVISVQGIASGTAMSVSVSNANANGSATSANSSPVVIASDQVAVAIKAASGSFASGALASGSISSGAFASGSVGSGAIASGAVASGAFASGSIGSGALASGSVASGAFASGAFAAGSFTNATASDACMFAAKTNLAFAQNTASLVQLIALSGSTKIYVCSITLISASANTVSFAYGTGSNCGTGTGAVIGSTTVANSLSFAANGGLTIGNGGGTIAVTPAAQALCLTIGSTTYVSGNLTYVQI